MNNRMVVVVVGMLLSAGCLAFGEAPDLVRQTLNEVGSLCVSNGWDYWTLEEPMNFEGLGENHSYRSFSDAVSNNWESTLSSLSVVATNNLERLLVLGVGKQYDEDFYVGYMEVLSDMRTNSMISAKEFTWARASTRHDLMSCLIRRYQEPKVRALLNKYKISIPAQTNRWDDILSGAAYTNYLEEVEAGLWQ